MCRLCIGKMQQQKQQHIEDNTQKANPDDNTLKANPALCKHSTTTIKTTLQIMHW